MGITRKMTLGVVGKSAKNKQREAEAKLAKESTKLIKEQTKAEKADRKRTSATDSSDRYAAAKAELAETRAEGARQKAERQAARAARKDAKNGAPALSETAAPADLVSSLERLTALRDSGAITEADYETAKAQLLHGPQ